MSSSIRAYKRPGIATALEALRRHRADALVVAKLDRLSRSLLDLAGLMETATREHWALVALDVNVDTTTPSGKAMASMMGVFAQLERDLIGQRTREALAIRRREGVQLGRPRLLPEAVVARIVAERAAGAALQLIADRLTAEGVPRGTGRTALVRLDRPGGVGERWSARQGGITVLLYHTTRSETADLILRMGFVMGEATT